MQQRFILMAAECFECSPASKNKFLISSVMLFPPFFSHNKTSHTRTFLLSTISSVQNLSDASCQPVHHCKYTNQITAFAAREMASFRFLHSLQKDLNKLVTACIPYHDRQCTDTRHQTKSNDKCNFQRTSSGIHYSVLFQRPLLILRNQNAAAALNTVKSEQTS